MLLTGCRLDEWAFAQQAWIDLEEALMVVPSDSYKSDHVHVVPPAIEILRALPAPTSGPYVLSSTGGSTPIQGISKFFNTQLRDQIIANTGAPLAKRLTSQSCNAPLPPVWPKYWVTRVTSSSSACWDTRTAVSPRSATVMAMCARCGAQS